MKRKNRFFIGFMFSVFFVSVLFDAVPIRGNGGRAESAGLKGLAAGGSIVKEDITKRGTYEKHFLLDDGSYIAVSYDEPVHYQQNGEWIEIDNTLVSLDKGDGSRRYITKSGFMNVAFSDKVEDSMVYLSFHEYSLSWKVYATASKKENDKFNEIKSDSVEVLSEPLLSVKNKSAIEIMNSDSNKDLKTAENKLSARRTKSGINYKNAIEDFIDINYSITSRKVKENFVINRPNKINSYLIDLNCPGLDACVERENQILLKNNLGEVIFTIEAPLMFDASGSTSEDIVLQLVSKGVSTCRIAVIPDLSWIEEEARVYPITIDPTYGVSSSLIQQNIIDNYVCSGEPNKNYDNTHPELYVGNRSGKNYSYIKHINLPVINGLITYASELLTLNKATSTAQNISAYMVNTGWESDTITWNNKPSNVELLSSDITPISLRSYLIDVTSAVRKWYTGSSNGNHSNYGIMIKYTDETINDHNSIYSGDYTNEESRPVITIYYTTSSLVTNGKYLLRNVKFGYYLDVYNGQNTSGTNVINAPLDLTEAQQWEIQSDGNGYYTLTPLCAKNLRLNVEAGADSNGTNLTVRTSNASDHQKFSIIFVGNGAYLLLPKSSRTHVLDGQGTVVSVDGVSGANVHLWEQNNSYTQQKWVLEMIETETCSREMTQMPTKNPGDTNSYLQRYQDAMALHNSASDYEKLLEGNNMINISIAADLGAWNYASTHPNASEMLRHYLDNTGTDYILSSTFIQTAADINNKRIELKNRIKASAVVLCPGDGYTITYGLKLLDSVGDIASNTDWKLAVNKCEVWATGTGTGSDLEVHFFVRDIYDWEANSNYSIFGIAADALYDLNRYGLACPYKVFGDAII